MVKPGQSLWNVRLVTAARETSRKQSCYMKPVLFLLDGWSNRILITT